MSANEPVPNGKYKVVVTKTNIGATKDGLNGAVKVNALIIDGPYKDKSLYRQFNIYHTDKTTSSMAYAELSAIGWAAGVFQMVESGTTDQMLPALHGKPHIWNVTVEADKVGKLRNQVIGFEDINGVDATKLAQGAVSQQPQGGPPGAGPPPGYGTQPAPGFAPPQAAPPQGQPAWNGGPTEPQQHTPPPPQQWGAPQGQPPQAPPQQSPQQWGAPAPQQAPQGAGGAPPQNWGPPPGGAPQAQPGAWSPAPQPNGAPPPIPWGQGAQR